MTDRISPLSTPAATRAVLEAHGLATKKSLGQNFLVNDDVLRKILELSEVGADDVVLEVGPGIGTLTIPLLKEARAVVSVERDRDLPTVLRGTCGPWAERFSLVEKDAVDLTEEDVRAALACPIAARAAGEGEEGAPGAPQAAASECAPAPDSLPLPNKFVANLPYAVAATVVLGYFQDFPWIDSATVMVQAEVADRMCAQPGSKNYGAYTVKLSLCAQVTGRFEVPPRCFMPAPHVDSAVIRLDRLTMETASNVGGARVPDDQPKGTVPFGGDSGVGIAAVCRVVDAAFAQRRKTIRNSMSANGFDKQALDAAFEACGIAPTSRAETLSVSDFVCLAEALAAVEADGR